MDSIFKIIYYLFPTFRIPLKYKELWKENDDPSLDKDGTITFDYDEEDEYEEGDGEETGRSIDLTIGEDLTPF